MPPQRSKKKGKAATRQKTAGIEQAFVRCRVSPGLFSHEFGIKLDLPDREFSTFVHRDLVVVEEKPTRTHAVDGKLKVSVVKPKEDTVIVDLPESGFVEGSRLEVPRGLVV